MPDKAPRERWPSRLSFVLASMGGAVGIGNLLRYPSVAARHSGLQWFIPYLFALLFIGIPVLMLEIAMGQSFAAASCGANNAIHRRLRGLGISTALIAFIVVTYYVTLMAWILAYLVAGFRNPVPWRADAETFLFDSIVRNTGPQGNATMGFLTYPDTGVVGSTVGYTALTWLVVYACIFKGVALTGRVVYVTMLLPLVLCFIILIRAVTLPNARDGIVEYIARWSSAKLQNGAIWTDSIVQIFFSIGTGFGYFIAYSSYNNPHANAVQDAIIIAFSNSAIEVIMGFAAFAVVGFIGLDLSKSSLTTFSLGYITYPAAIAQIPGSKNAWAFFFFLTVYLLAIDSAFALLESFISVIQDTDWGSRPRKELTIGIISIAGFLFSLIYATQFGLYALDAVDKWVTEITLIFATFFQCVTVTSMYRYRDVISQTGFDAFLAAQAAYLGSMVLGVVVAHVANFIWWGFLTFVLILVLGTALAVFISNPPSEVGGFGSNSHLNALWWLTSYSGHQLMRDFNEVIGRGRNWKLPFMWAPLLRWISAPVLISILSLGYRKFGETATLHKDPLQVFGFVVAHVGVGIAVIGFFAPQVFSTFVPLVDIDKGLKQYETAPGVTLKSDVDLTDSGEAAEDPERHVAVAGSGN